MEHNCPEINVLRPKQGHKPVRLLGQDRIVQGHVMDTIKGFLGSEDQTGALVLGGMVAGTRIRTLEGLLPVEYLEPGDRIVTRSGARRLLLPMQRLQQRQSCAATRSTTTTVH